MTTRCAWGFVAMVGCSDPIATDDGPTTLLVTDPMTADTAPPPDPEPVGGLDGRPANPDCTAFSRPDGTGGGDREFPSLLSQTGCMDASAPERPGPGLVPYRTAHEFWSDGADKERWFAIPDGTRLTIGADGRWALPVGSIVVKQFSRLDLPIETRLYVHHDDGWAGYSYAWTDDGSDAVYAPTGQIRPTPSGAWSIPSSEQCVECHTAAAGFTLGLRTEQLTSSITYPSTGRTAPQLATLVAADLVENPPADPLATPALPARDDDSASVEDLARTYLDVNCAPCHRLDGDAQGRAEFDVRLDTPLAETGLCDVAPQIGIGPAFTALVAPGAPDRSVLLERMGRRDFVGMPPAASLIPDPTGLEVVEDWIASLPGCG